MLTTTLYEGLLFVVAPAFLQNLSKGRCGYPTKREFTKPIFCPHRPFFFDIHGGSWRSTSWGTCDYEASEPPFSSIWPVRSWLPFGKIHFNPTFFIPHRPFLTNAPDSADCNGVGAVAAGGEQPRGQLPIRDRSGAHGVTIITCRREAVHPQSISSLSFRCAPPLRAGHLPSAVRGLPI